MFRLNSDLYHYLADELWSFCSAGTWLMCILRCNDDHVARKQQYGTAECRFLIELEIVLRMILLQYETIALAVAELLLAGDHILDVEKLIVGLEEALIFLIVKLFAIIYQLFFIGASIAQFTDAFQGIFD